MGKFEMPLDYIDVATRITEFRTKYPEGSLQQIKLDFITFAGQDWVLYVAGAFRSPGDTLPGIGSAWEPVPGKTNFTRDSELQNAETAAWGRAIVAALAADTKKGIASAEEVRNRQEDDTTKAVNALVRKLNSSFPTGPERKEYVESVVGHPVGSFGDLLPEEIEHVLSTLKNGVKNDQ